MSSFRQWEYRLEMMVEGDYPRHGNILNELGRDGWELTTTVSAWSGVIVAYLKRPLLSTSERLGSRRLNDEAPF